METTSLDDLFINNNTIADASNNEPEVLIDYDNLQLQIFNFELPLKLRLFAIEKYYELNPEQIIEVIVRLCSMYEFSGNKTIQEYLKNICLHTNISSISKSIIINCFYGYNEKNIITYDLINELFPKLDLPTPNKIEFIYILINEEKYIDNAKTYFCNFINDEKIDVNYRYKNILKMQDKNTYIGKNALLTFIRNINNNIRTRILSGQCLMQYKTDDFFTEVENILLSISLDKTLDENIQADATDVLLKLGSPATKLQAQKIIMEIGSGERKISTIYDNSQNVHVKEIEESLLKGIEFLNRFPTMKYKNDPITLEYVENQIQEFTKEMSDYIKQKIKVSINRIYMDRCLYSTYNFTLTNILIKIWSYIHTHKDSESIKNRLIEELIEMADTCSSGFATRLLNSISGFGDFNFEISWENQISANLSGRLNALIRNMDDLNLQEKLLYEMTLSNSSIYEERKDFLKFFVENISNIREEMFQEFKGHIPDEDFDLYFRKAISIYESGITIE
jgi:hypothetical protein